MTIEEEDQGSQLDRSTKVKFEYFRYIKKPSLQTTLYFLVEIAEKN